MSEKKVLVRVTVSDYRSVSLEKTVVIGNGATVAEAARFAFLEAWNQTRFPLKNRSAALDFIRVLPEKLDYECLEVWSTGTREVEAVFQLEKIAEENEEVMVRYFSAY